MKRLLLLGIFGFIAALSSVTSAQALVVIDDVLDVAVVGDFIVFGNNIASGTGQNYEVLKFSPRGNATTATSTDGGALDQAPHGDVVAGQLWTLLDDNGILSTNRLVFGFDVNQNTDSVFIDSLVIELFDPVAATTLTFTTGEQIEIYDAIAGNGSSTAEARFQIDLPFDFMQRYSGVSTAHFKITATHSGANAGFEEYFLSAAFTGGVPTNHVPEPATMALFGAGLLGFGLKRKKKIS